MIKRRRGQLHLASFGQLAVQGDDLGQQRALLVQEPGFFDFGIIPPLCQKLRQLRVLLEEQGMEPGQVRPDLKVTEVALPEPGQGLFAGRDAQPTHLVKFPVAGMWADHGIGEGHEKVVDQVKRVISGKPVGGHA